jgi:LacI family transcriptional regulator
MVDVAAAAKVSLKTVSRVVNQEAGVNARTAARVTRAIAALGFVRNEGASNLRRGHSTASLGLVLEDVADPFYAALSRAVEEVARLRRYLVLAGSSDEDPVREKELALAFCARRVDGLIVVPTHADHGYLAPELEAGVRAVFVDRPAVGLPADEVLVDNAGGARAAVEHLQRHGHRRIAFIGDSPAIFTAQERLQGYTAGLSGRGGSGAPERPRAIDRRLVAMGPHTEASVHAALERFRALVPAVTAVVSGNNRMTVHLLRTLRAFPGWRPALVGFDDVELGDLLVPALTVIEQSPSQLGREAANLLFARLAGDRSPPRRVVLPTRLVARGSGELRPDQVLV